jgi:ATP-dependent Clp protease ATP-binding subunit ClpA
MWLRRLFDALRTASGDRVASESSGGLLNLSDRAKKILAMAAGKAADRNHPEIDPEHILLALAVERGGVAAKALRSLGVDLTGLMGHAELLLPPRGAPGTETPSTSERGRRVIEFALEDARLLGNPYVGTEAILLGILREEGPAARKLVELGASYAVVRRGIRAILGIEEIGFQTCPKCKYDLRQSSNRCAECGRLIEPMNSPPPPLNPK